MKCFASAADRNRKPILAVLESVLPRRGTVLEVASGTGQHITYFARQLPRLNWQPSDPDPNARASIRAWTEDMCLPNVAPPLDLDAARERWPIDAADAILCINMIHIAPWEACEGLIRGAARLLGPGQVLVAYGPYRRGGCHTAPSNAHFDRSLRAQDPRWGVRDLEDVQRLAEGAGFELDRVEDMPANNLTVVFRRGLPQR
jgi:SAM-dependent methyltransferase